MVDLITMMIFDLNDLFPKFFLGELQLRAKGCQKAPSWLREARRLQLFTRHDRSETVLISMGSSVAVAGG